MDVEKAIVAILADEPSPVFKTGRFGLPRHGKLPILFRDDEMAASCRFVKSVFDGHPSTMLIHGQDGSGKTTMTRAIHEQLVGRVPCAFVSCTGDMVPAFFHEIIRRELFNEHGKCTIGTSRERIATLASRQPVLVFVEQVDRVKYTVRKEIAWMMNNGISIVATARSGEIPGYRWDEMVMLQSYTREQMVAILDAKVKDSVNDGVVQDAFLLESIAASILKKEAGNMTRAVSLLDEALKHVEMKCIDQGTRDARLLAVDIDEAAAKKWNALERTRLDPRKDFTELFIAFVISIKHAVTLATLMKSLQVAMNEEFPGKRVPSESTVRNVLRKLRVRCVIKQKKKSAGFSGGVKTYWMPDENGASMLGEMRSILESWYMKRLVRYIND